MPSANLELFPSPSGFHPDPERKEPLLWVRELRVYRAFSPGEGNLLRRIVLRPGLNILWAHPRSRPQGTQPRAAGVSGHATGKTTFCRLLRYVLGESKFGTDEQRNRLQEKFPQGSVVAEVRIDGESWLIRRPMQSGGLHLAFRGRTIETLFEDSDQERGRFDDYRQHLTKVLAEPLPVTTFATSPTPIEWPHLLQWLTRDQECRFAGMAELRHSSSESHSPNMVAEDTHFLFRAVLGLIDLEEQAEIERNKEYLRQKQVADNRAPLLKFRSESAAERLMARLSDFRQDLNGADFLDAVATEWKTRAQDSEAAIVAMREPGAVEIAREELLKARDIQRRAEEQKKRIDWDLKLIDQQLTQLRGGSMEALDTWLRNNAPPGDQCGHTLAEAIEWECPLAAGRKLPIETRAAEVPTQPTIESLERRRARELAQLPEIVTALSDSTKEVSAIAEALQRELARYDKTRSDLAKQQAEEQAIASEAKRAYDDQVESDRLESSIKNWEQKIRTSQGLQDQIRRQQSSTLSNFSETFARISRFIIDDNVRGAIRFSGRKVDPTFTAEIDLTSAALVTLKIICFDLAALVSGVEGRGAHPRFLVHDGPREADMDAEIYGKIFELAREVEAAFEGRAPNFQYIITTTEPPPEEMQVEPFLLTPTLDASTREGKLLGEHF